MIYPIILVSIRKGTENDMGNIHTAKGCEKGVKS